MFHLVVAAIVAAVIYQAATRQCHCGSRQPDQEYEPPEPTGLPPALPLDSALWDLA